MHKNTRPAALFALAISSLLFSATNSPAAYSSPAPTAFSAAVATAEEAVAWDFRPFSNLVGAANAEDKNVLVYFWVGGSGQCEQFYRDTLQSEGATDATADFICYSAGHGDASSAKLFERYNITTVPAIRVLDGSGEAIDGLNGFADIATLTTELERILKGEGTLPALLKSTEAAPEDMDLRNQLAGKYQDLGDQETHDKLQDSIRKEDPLGKSDIGASLLLNDMITTVGEKATRPSEVDLKPIYALANSLENPVGKFQAWNWLSFTESAFGDTKAEMSATHEAWKHYSADSGGNWIHNKVNWMLSMPDQLSKADKALVLEMATMAMDSADKKCGDGDCSADGVCTDKCAESEGDHDDTGAMQNLSRAYYLNGMKAEALELTEACLEMQPEDPIHQARDAAFRKGKDDVFTEQYSDTRPVWSPNGKDVLFTSDRDGNLELYLASVKKGSAKRLTFTQSNETSGSFGPKGKTIAFNSDSFGLWTVFTMTTKGKNLEILQPVDPAAPYGLSDASYSPNGKRIVYCTTKNGKSEIAVSDKNGKNEVILTAESENTDMQPVWSLDGKRILYMSTRMGDSDIYSISPDGDDDQNITNAPQNSWDMDGHLSDNGRSIVFASWRSGNLDIYRMDAEGTHVVNLTNSEATEDRHPQFSPDGKRILFERMDENGFARLWTMDSDGANPQALLQ